MAINSLPPIPRRHGDGMGSTASLDAADHSVAQLPLVDQCHGSEGRLNSPYRAALAASQR